MSEERRCIICDWPLKERMEDGCIPGNCSYRPRDGSEEWRKLDARRELVARIKAEQLSTTEHSLASFKTRAERAEAVVEAATIERCAKEAEKWSDSRGFARLIAKRIRALSLLHQPTETGTPK